MKCNVRGIKVLIWEGRGTGIKVVIELMGDTLLCLAGAVLMRARCNYCAK